METIATKSFEMLQMLAYLAVNFFHETNQRFVANQFAKLLNECRFDERVGGRLDQLQCPEKAQFRDGRKLCIYVNALVNANVSNGTVIDETDFYLTIHRCVQEFCTQPLFLVEDCTSVSRYH